MEHAATRVAALYDIHGNLPALEAVLDDVRRANVDLIVVGGDVVPGPMPRETFACLRALDVPAVFIRGNGDREVLARLQGIDTTTVPEPFRPLLQWCANQLTAGEAAAIAAWPSTRLVRVTVLGDIFFCHATPRNDIDIFTRLTPEEQVAPLFAGVEAQIAVCGHTHMQFDRVAGARRVVNAGSVGMPFGEPGAYWLLLGPDVQLRRTQYDLVAAAERIRATAYPQAAAFADGNVLSPPSESQMLAAFAGKAPTASGGESR